MKTNIRVAGTSFHPLPENEYVRVKRIYVFEEIPCADVDAVLMPEPENQYDPEAVKVLVPLENGKPFHIGYVPKDVPLKKIIRTPHPAVLMVKNYAMNNPHYNPSWLITEVTGIL